MQSARLIVWSLVVASVGTAAAPAAENAAVAGPQVLRVRLAPPSRLPLTENEIRTALSGKTLLLDVTTALLPSVVLDVIVEGGCPPVERFYPDGRWEKGICARAYRVDKGRWSIKTDRFGSTLCTSIEGRNPNCRAVWGRTSTDRLILTVNGLHADGDPEYNPYRTSPL